jgi:hypothetical protein
MADFSMSDLLKLLIPVGAGLAASRGPNTARGVALGLGAYNTISRDQEHRRMADLQLQQESEDRAERKKIHDWSSTEQARIATQRIKKQESEQAVFNQAQLEATARLAHRPVSYKYKDEKTGEIGDVPPLMSEVAPEIRENAAIAPQLQTAKQRLTARGPVGFDEQARQYAMQPVEGGEQQFRAGEAATAKKAADTEAAKIAENSRIKNRDEERAHEDKKYKERQKQAGPTIKPEFIPGGTDPVTGRAEPQVKKWRVYDSDGNPASAPVEAEEAKRIWADLKGGSVGPPSPGASPEPSAVTGAPNVVQAEGESTKEFLVRKYNLSKSPRPGS